MKDQATKDREKQQRKDFIVGLLGALMGLLFYSLVVMISWNFLIEELLVKSGDHFIILPNLKYSQALVLYILCQVLFSRNELPKKKSNPSKDMDEKAIQIEVLKRKTFN